MPASFGSAELILLGAIALLLLATPWIPQLRAVPAAGRTSVR